MASGIIGATLLAVLMAGCGAASHQATLQPSTTTRPDTTARPGTNHGATSTSTGSLPPGQCRTSDLQAGLGAKYQEAPGQDQVALVYENVARAPCTLSGFPGFELVAASTGKTASYNPPRQGVPTTPVVLTSGARAHALFTYDTTSDFCGSGVTSWSPTQVDTIPPDETTILTVPWPDGSFDTCSGELNSAGASIGPIEAGGAPATAPASTIAVAQANARTLYPSNSPGPPSYESSGVVVDGTNLWLAVALQTAVNEVVSVAVYNWTGDQWAQQGTVPLSGFPALDGGVGGGSVTTASLTGSPAPDFLMYGNGADWGALSVISDAGGTWHAVPFDEGVASTVSAFGAVTGNVIWGGEDLCGCATSEPSADEWFQCTNGVFQPAEPLGPIPVCHAPQLSTIADSSTSTTTLPGSTTSTLPGPVTFADAACDDGWALAKGTAGGAPVVGLFNWQGSEWVMEDVGGDADLSSDPSTFAIPADLLQRLAGDIDVTVPPPTPQ